MTAPESSTWASRLDGVLTLSRNGTVEVFVPQGDYEDVCEREAKLRQTLALISPDLYRELPPDHPALARLAAAGFDPGMARAVAGIVAQFSTRPDAQPDLEETHA